MASVPVRVSESETREREMDSLQRDNYILTPIHNYHVLS